MKNSISKWSILGLLTLILLFIPITEVSAASQLNLYFYNTKKTLKYTGKQVKYSLDGNNIDMKGTPGVIIDGTSLASYLEVFVKSPIGLKASYSDKKGVLTLSSGKTKLVLTAGSKTAVLNSKKVTMPQAAVKVKFKESSKIKFLVPVEFVANSFGYVYTWNNSTVTGCITNPLHISYNGKEVNYTGTRGLVTVDGEVIDVSDMPGIIMNNTTLVQGVKVFSESSIGAEYQYDKASGVLTLTKDSTEVVLTMGQKTANVNGRERTMDTAPLLITNLDNSTDYIMVPGSFVAASLGYDYKWNSATKTSVLTKSEIVPIPDTDNTGGTGSPETPVPDSVAFHWDLSTAISEEFNKLNVLTETAEVSQDKSATSYITAITKSDSTANSETFAIYGNLPFSKAALTSNNGLLNLHINNASTNYQTLFANGLLAQSVTANMDTTATTAVNIGFSLTETGLKYELSQSNDGCILYVKLYRNMISRIEAGVSQGNEYLKITGMKGLKAQVNETGDTVTLQFSSTVNGTGDNSIQPSLSALKSVTTAALGNNTVINFVKNSNATYRIEQNGNTCLIVFNRDSGGEYSLHFSLPDGVSYSELTTEDQYLKNRIIIKIPGEWASYYNQYPVSWSDDVINTAGLLEIGGETQIIIDTAALQGFRLEEQGNGVVTVTLGNPRDIYKNIVVLDPGHGGSAPGAARSFNGKTVYEKDLNLKILYELAEKYFNSPDSPVKAYYTRTDDSSLGLYERPAIADLVNADIFVSLHMNANTKSEPKGTEIYYTSTNTNRTASGLNSKVLANFVLDKLTEQLGTNKRYISSKKLVVTREANVPAVLIELGYMSNKSELSLLTDEVFQENAAYAIYNTICQLFEVYPTDR
jgi:N-acetylmuramoyl-L-alanine amidase